MESNLRRSLRRKGCRPRRTSFSPTPAPTQCGERMFQGLSGVRVAAPLANPPRWEPYDSVPGAIRDDRPYRDHRQKVCSYCGVFLLSSPKPSKPEPSNSKLLGSGVAVGVTS